MVLQVSAPRVTFFEAALQHVVRATCTAPGNQPCTPVEVASELDPSLAFEEVSGLAQEKSETFSGRAHRPFRDESTH